MKIFFRKQLLHWHSTHNTREMPWKGEKDPYRIWLSEIILQQTRVEQGLAYYHRFIHMFPSVHKLAEAPEREVYKLWEGLGYYSRCKNLLETAKVISEKYKGKFPDNYHDIRALKGIGPYTAAAIASFAYNLPYAVVDGNVLRVLSRYFAIDIPIDSTEGKKKINLLADELLDKHYPALYNQAIMDFGAVICKAQQPLCTACVQKQHCKAYNNNLVKMLPLKEKTLTKKTRWFYYFLVEYGDMLFIRKRNTKDIWENLFEFVFKESDKEIGGESSSFTTMFKSLVNHQQFTINYVSEVFSQKLTHQTIVARFIKVSVAIPAFVNKEYEPVLKNDLVNYPFPKIITNWLRLDQLV